MIRAMLASGRGCKYDFAAMKRLLLLLALLLAAISGFADGMVVPSTAYPASVTIPDQRALICWSNGVERLVIETRFIGRGKDFAWVVPLPAVPEIEAATPGLFPTLSHQLRPHVVHDPLALFPIITFCMAIGYMLLYVRPAKGYFVRDLVACVVAGLSALWFSGVGGVVLFPILLWKLTHIRDGHGKPYDLILYILLVLVIPSFFLSTLGGASASRNSTLTSNVTELARQRVGAFDVQTLTAKTPKALLDWLNDHQFVAPTNAEPLIADYLTDGWVFVAAKLHRDNLLTAANAIHPLSFTFRAAQPVYPMRLTGLGNGPLSVELYVFGSEGAEAKNFHVARCAPVEFPRESPWRRRLNAETPIAVMHPVLRNWVAGRPIVTKLTATLTPEQMREDVAIEWTAFSPHLETLYDRQAALITSADLGMAAVAGLSLLAVILLAKKPQWKPAGGKIAAAIGLVGCVLFARTYLTLPQVAVRVERHLRGYLPAQMESLGRFVQAQWRAAPPATIAAARTALDQSATAATRNRMLGGRMREEDSPGNYVIRPATNGFVFVWFDADGGEHVMGMNP